MKPYSSILVVAIIISAFAAGHAHAACVSLSADLTQGFRDGSARQVTSLQTYLVASGYLTATPTGYFGPATFAAVKKYQKAHNINATGYVGPLTRAALQKTSCVAVTVNATPPTIVPTTTPITISVQATTTPVSSAPNPSAIVVTAPGANETLTAGKSYTIQWTGKANNTYNILLEDSTGVGEGFIAMNVYHANSYVWNVGDVTTLNSTASWNPALPTGTYRIHVVDAIGGPAPSDQPSPSFSLVATPLAITSISPSYVSSNSSAANPTVVTVYGSGFDRTTQVTLQGTFTSTVYPTYIFPQGNELIFNVPKGLAAGKYGVGLSNTYGSFSSSATTLTVSN